MKGAWPQVKRCLKQWDLVDKLSRTQFTEFGRLRTSSRVRYHREQKENQLQLHNLAVTKVQKA